MKYRMYCIVRGDLGDVPTGKLLGQSGHAFAHSLMSAPAELAAEYHADPEHKKIVLKAPDELALSALALRCAEQNVPCHLVTDFAHTVFKEPTVTCLGIGPLTEEVANKVLNLRGLPLYK